MKPNLTNSVILITGASSGIGRELARQIAADAKVVFLVARREDRLVELQRSIQMKNPSALIRTEALDITNEACVIGFFQKLKSEGLQVNCLINCAGVGFSRLFSETTPEEIEKMIRVNVCALTSLTRQVIPGMIGEKNGAILNISSGFAIAPFAGYAVYSATKAYVSILSEVLSAELRAHGIYVGHACPGPVNTEFQKIAGPPLGIGLPGFAFQSAHECASQILKALRKGRVRIFPGWRIRILMACYRLTPLWFYRLTLRWMILWHYRRIKPAPE